MATKREASGGTPDVSTANKVLSVRTPGGKVFRLESDFEFGEIVDIASANDTNWSTVVANPLFVGSGKVALDLFRKACEKAGEPVPDPLPTRVVFDSINAVADDSPQMYADGVPTEAEQATTSSPSSA